MQICLRERGGVGAEKVSSLQSPLSALLPFPSFRLRPMLGRVSPLRLLISPTHSHPQAPYGRSKPWEQMQGVQRSGCSRRQSSEPGVVAQRLKQEDPKGRLP